MRARGCSGYPRTHATRIVVPRVGVFARCPRAWLLEDAREQYQLWRDYLVLRSHGIWPEQGGLLDQDPRFVSAVSTIDATLHDMREAMA
jgi:hypothetical protein